MSEEIQKTEGSGVDSKKMLKDLANEKRKIKFNDRVNVEVIKKTKHYRKGQKLNPHRTFAEELIKKKIAKEVK